MYGRMTGIVVIIVVQVVGLLIIDKRRDTTDYRALCTSIVHMCHPLTDGFNLQDHPILRI